MAKSTEKAQVEQPVDANEVGTDETSEAQVEPVQLQISDLQALGQIVNLASKRGAFEAPELQYVGATYNRLTAFLGYVASQQTEEGTEEASSEAEAQAEAQAEDTGSTAE